MQKTSTNSGFTIIEVVITIAIGAAVMALVLNAVAGARRSQRNNARVSDVSRFTSSVGEYIATRNTLPQNWGQISSIVGDDLGHYDSGATTTMTPAACSDTTYTTPATCTAAGETWTAASTTTNTESINPIGAWNGSNVPNSGGVFPTLATTGAVSPPTTPSGAFGGSDEDAADEVVVWLEAQCTTNKLSMEPGGIRDMVIFYRLEGQQAPICLDV